MSKKLGIEDLFKAAEAFGVPDPSDPKYRTRARLIRAATELFQRRGYRKTSIDDVAREAAVGKGTVYLHFRNKAELLLHAISEEKKRYLTNARELLLAAPNPEQRLRTAIEFGLAATLDAPLVSALLSGDREMYLALEELAPDLQAQIRSWQTEGMEALLEGVGSIDSLAPEERADRAAALYAILVNAPLLMDARVRGRLDVARFSQLVAQILVKGIGAP